MPGKPSGSGRLVVDATKVFRDEETSPRLERLPRVTLEEVKFHPFHAILVGFHLLFLDQPHDAWMVAEPRVLDVLQGDLQGDSRKIFDGRLGLWAGPVLGGVGVGTVVICRYRHR